VKALRPLIPSLAALLLAAAAGASGQGVLIDRSEVRFVARAAGATVEGRFRKWRANVDFRPDDLAKSKAAFEIDLASIDLASEESEAESRRPPWFDTARFPVAKFTSTAMKDVGGDRYEIAGTLSMKGMSRDVVVPVAMKKDAAGNRVAEGHFVLKRLDWRLGEGPWADTDAVANEVTVRVRIALAPAR
jgi:polyisoprenoid-binding protein YceI